MSGQVVVAIYRPKPAQGGELKRLIGRHMPTLRNLGLVTDRAPVLLESSDGTLIEIFEWRDQAAVATAHENERVQELWSAMEDVADFATLADLPEATKQFPHFTPLG